MSHQTLCQAFLTVKEESRDNRNWPFTILSMVVSTKSVNFLKAPLKATKANIRYESATGEKMLADV